MPSDIDAWLKQFGLEKYAPAFVENEVGVADLAHLSDDDLKDLGLPLGPRRRIQAVISDERIAEPADETGTQPPNARLETPGPLGSMSDAQRRQITVMFVDLVGSTQLARQIELEDLNHVNRAYQAAATEAIQRYGGNVAKYMGDGLLAYFGYPVAHEDDAERSVRAGLDLVEAVKSLDLSDKIGNEAKLSVRVGIATGMVVVGDLIGEGLATERSVLGETPNMAARIEAAAQPNTVAVSPSTYTLTSGVFEYASLGEHALKGFEDKIALWQAASVREGTSRFKATRARHATPLVGRDDELALLVRRWRSAADGVGHAVLLSGEPGIGKSRLAAAFRAEIATMHHIRLMFQCSPHHTNSPFHPFIEQLSHASGLRGDAAIGEKRSRVEQLLRRVTDTSDEDVSAVLSLLNIEEGSDPDLSAQARKARLIAALTKQFHGLSREAPVLCLIEDVHWSDASTLEVLDHLLAEIETTAALILITARPEFEPPWAGQPCTTLLTLGRMGARDSRQLVTETVHSTSLPQEAINAIAERADGNPLFIEELTQAAVERATIEHNATETNRVPSGSNPSIPATLLDSLVARLDRSPAAREVAQVASIIGRDFEYAVLNAIADLSHDQISLGINQLVDSSLIQLRGNLPDAECRFKHALIRDAAYGTLTRDRRQRLHETLARHLDSGDIAVLTVSQPEVIAYHYAEADLNEKAIQWYEEASRQAVDQSAFNEAAVNLQKAASLSLKIIDEAARIRTEFNLQVALGRVLGAAHGYGSEEAEAAFLRAYELSKAIDSEEDRFRVLIGLRSLNHLRGRLLQAADFGEHCLEIAEHSQQPILLSQAHIALAHTRCFQGNFSLADVHLEACANSYSSDQHAAHLNITGLDAGVFGAALHAWVNWFGGQLSNASDSMDRAEVLSAEVGHAQSREHVLSTAAQCYLFGERYEDALKTISAALALAEKYGFEMRIAMGRIVEYIASAKLGETAPQQPVVLAGLIDRYRATGSQAFGTYYHSLSAVAMMDSGDIAGAIEKIDDTLSLGSEIGEHMWDAELLRLKGIALSQRGDSDLNSAIGCVQQAVNTAKSQGATMLQLRALCSLIELKEGSDVRRMIDELQLVYDQCQQDPAWPDIATAGRFLAMRKH